jgi:hypothetical protein
MAENYGGSYRMAEASAESTKLLGFVLKHQSVFEAIKRAADDPTNDNVEDMQRAIMFLVQRERSDARQSIWVPLALALPIILAALKYLWR